MTRHHDKANPPPHSGCRQRNQADFREDFFAAFFSFRGSPLLFFFCSFGTRVFAGFATPAAAAMVPAASPTALAAFTSAPSCGSVASFFFAMAVILSFSGTRRFDFGFLRRYFAAIYSASYQQSSQ
jgi:hypothetical protein